MAILLGEGSSSGSLILSPTFNCTHFNQDSEDEYNEVRQMIAEENEALADMPQSEQAEWEGDQESLKNWLGNYSNLDTGPTYNGIAI